VEIIDPFMRERARELRNTQTDTEQKLWQALRKRQIQNAKFRPQHCVGQYIVDFICLSHKLIVEVDGGHHLEQAEYDFIRTEYLNAAGYQVIRFWNDEVLHHFASVLEVIHNRIVAISTLPMDKPRRGEIAKKQNIYLKDRVQHQFRAATLKFPHPSGEIPSWLSTFFHYFHFTSLVIVSNIKSL